MKADGPSKGAVQNRSSWAIWVALVFGFSVLMFVPFEGAYQIGGDEGFELMKGCLWSKGFTLYRQIWSEQPPLLTAILGVLFRFLGPSAADARFLDLVFSCILLAGYLVILEDYEGRFTAMTAALFLSATPLFLTLSISAMPEVPAFAVAVTSALMLRFWKSTGRSVWLCASGLGMGTALMIKLTAGILLPALVVELLSVGSLAKSKGNRMPVLLAFWTVPLAGVVLCVFIMFPGMSFHQLLGLHYSQQLREATKSWADLQFSALDLYLRFACAIPAVIGLLSCAADGQMRRVRFPVIWLGTAILANYVNRPFWAFYYLHFAPPLAWLGAVGLRVLFVRVITTAPTTSWRFVQPKVLWLVLLAVVSSYSLAGSAWGALHEWRAVSGARRTADVRAIAVLSHYRRSVHWIYTTSLLDAFYSRIMVPPELAVISFKRVASGELSAPDIFQYLMRYQPEVLLLDHQECQSADWREFLISYNEVFSDQNRKLFVAKWVK